MGISERKEREKGEMKQLIRTAAVKMFAVEGYAKTSIRNIADAIEYSPGTIYLYYKDKDELLYEVQHHAYDQLAQFFNENATDKDPLKRVRQLGQAYISFGLDNPELYDLMFIIRAPTNVDDDLHKDNGEPCFQILVSCLQECIDKKLVRTQDVMLGSLQLWSMVHGLVSLNLRCRLKVMEFGTTEVKEVLMAATNDYVDSMII